MLRWLESYVQSQNSLTAESKTHCIFNVYRLMVNFNYMTLCVNVIILHDTKGNKSTVPRNNFILALRGQNRKQNLLFNKIFHLFLQN